MSILKYGLLITGRYMYIVYLSMNEEPARDILFKTSINCEQVRLAFYKYVVVNI